MLRPDRVRGAVAVGDQVVSSASNVVLGLAALAALGLEQVGAVSVVTAVYGIALAASRGINSDLLVAVHAGEPRVLVPRVRTAALGAGALGLGIGSALVVLGQWAVRGPLGGVLVLLALSLPVLLAQDVLRYGAFAAREPRQALVIDLVWLLTQLAALCALSLTHHLSTDGLIGTWALGAAASLACGLALLRSRAAPGRVRARSYYGDSLGLWTRYLTESLLVSGSGQVLVVATAALAGLRTAGSLKLLNLAFSPVYLLLLGVGPLITAEAAVRVREAAASLDAWGHRRQRELVAFSVVSTSAIAVTLVGVPPSRRLLDASGDPRLMAFLYAVFIAATSACVLPQALLRARSLAALSLRTRLLSLTGSFLAPLLGLAAGGADGFVTGLAVGATAVALLWTRAAGSRVATT